MPAHLEKLRALSSKLDEIERQDAIKREREMFLVLNGIVDTVIVFDTNSTIKYANHSCMRLLGYDPEELIGKPFRSIVSANLKVDVNQETTAMTKDKCPITVNVHMGEIVDPASQLHLYIVVLKKVINHADTESRN